MAGATMTTAGTGEIPTTGNKTPGDVLMENLLNSVVGPTVNGILDVSATTTGSGTKTGTSTTEGTKTETGTKVGGTSLAAQSLINQQITDLQTQLQGGDAQYKDLISNILTNAAQTFNPTNTTSRRSGAYNSTTLDLLRNDAQARATASAADAVLYDKRAKLSALVGLIEQNAQVNKLENTSATGTGTNTTTGNENTTDTKNVEANRIGKGAANAAKVGGAALLASSLLKGDVGKSLTAAGMAAVKKIFDMANTSGTASNTGVTGLPDDWFEDWSSGTTSTDDILKALGTQEADSAAMEEAIADVFGSTAGGASWLSSGNAYAGYGAAVANALDGEWGGNDLGSTVGATLGSYFGPIGSTVGSWLGNAVGESALDGTESYLANSGAGLFTGDASVGDVISSGFGVKDILETDMNVVNDAADAIGGLVSGCFITTACMQALKSDFKDDCWELTTLRSVRDNYIANLPEGPSLIAAYKKYAPEYVQLLEARPDSKEVWLELYTDFILPAVVFADAGKLKKAYHLYLMLLQRVQDLTSGVA